MIKTPAWCRVASVSMGTAAQELKPCLALPVEQEKGIAALKQQRNGEALSAFFFWAFSCLSEEIWAGFGPSELEQQH